MWSSGPIDPACLLPGFVPEAVIFDLDGVLLDTEPLYTQSTQAVLDPYGKRFEWSLKERTIGRTSLEASALLIQELELPLDAEDFLTRRDEVLLRLLEDVSEIPGAENFTRRLRAGGLNLAVATSSNDRLYRIKIRRHGNWFPLFQVQLCGDDLRIAHPKPAPDIFLLAAQELGVDPHRCLVFEDSPAGVAAALAGGMKVIAIPDPSLNPDLIQGAHRVIRGYDDFLVGR